YTPGGARRKGSGTFYTPRAMTEFVVRRTLAPLVHERSPEQILTLRIVDPALGSGAFLVAACRYLAGAYEEALSKEGSVSRQDVAALPRCRSSSRHSSQATWRRRSTPVSVWPRSRMTPPRRFTRKSGRSTTWLDRLVRSARGEPPLTHGAPPGSGRPRFPRWR